MAIYRGVGGSGNATDDATIAEVSQLASQAATSATNAANSATSAASSASGASSSATSAANSASAAASSASNAASSASSAAGSVSLAASEADAAEASALAAAASASDASSSASNALSSANTAASARDAAEVYKDAAEAAETGAEAAYANTLAIYGDTTDVAAAVAAASSSASSASSSAAAAAGSASSASSSATNAANSAIAALASQNAAASSASNASATASNITALFNDLDAVNTAVELSEGYKNDAGASAVAAASSASSAIGSAANASNSATQAAASAASASAIVLGVASGLPSIAPTLNLDFANTETLDPRVTFSRASTATYYDGKTVAKAEENLLLQSETLLVGWVVVASTLTSSQTDPKGTTTAFLLTANGSSSGHNVQSLTTSFISGLVYTTSVFAKAGTNNFVQLRMTGAIGAPFANFDLSTGTVGTTSATASMTDVGGGWYRCTITYTASATTSAALGIFIVSSNTAASAEINTLATTVFLWGAQVEQRSSVTAYTPTTTQPITNYVPRLLTAAAGVPRFEHNPVTGESLGLEIEEQRTNLLLRSEEFENAYWTKNAATVTANTIVAPDGTLTGDKFVEGTTADPIALARTGLSFTVANTFTCYAKAGENRYVVVRCFAGIGNYGNVTFDLQTGVITQTNSVGVVTVIGAITNVGNGWYRLSATASSTGGIINIVGFIMSNTATPTFSTQGVLAAPYTGDGYSGIYIWGAQLEAGAFPTSYIPTVASQVTRSADAASMTGTNFSSWYRADEGTLFADGFSSGARPFAALGQGTFATDISFNGANLIRHVGTQPFLALGTAVSGALKLAAAVKPGDFAASANGGNTVTSTVNQTVSFTATQLQIGGVSSSFSLLNGTIKKIAYYPLRLTDAQLQALTS